MIDASLPDTNAEIAILMREKLGLRGADRLAVKMRKGGRLLPRGVRKQGSYLVEMEQRWANPRLRRTIDPVKVGEAQEAMKAHLSAIDARDRRIGRIIGILAPLAFNVLMIGIGIVVWLVMTDRV